MRKAILAAALVAAFLFTGAPAQRAAAMSIATPAQLGLATTDGGLVQKAAVFCGPWGCLSFWGWHRPFPFWGWHRHWGWYRPWGWHRGWGGHRHFGWRHHWRHR
jgi:hypothetical protein